MSITKKRVEKTVELVCRRGCEYVRQVIADLDDDETADIAELRELRLVSDRDAVLAELKEIMSVYDESGGGCCPLPRSSAQSGQAQA
ncbi:MAG: hypothetical protein ACWGOV_03380 [Acidiferrobacterales bacterium]